MVIYYFVSGALTAGFVTAALFFLSFWRRTLDGLFAAFALAFALLGLSQALLVLTQAPVEDKSWIYAIRLLAFLVILFAIMRKNRRA